VITTKRDMVVNVKQMVCNEGNSDFSSIVTDNDETHKRDANKKGVGISRTKNNNLFKQKHTYK